MKKKLTTYVLTVFVSLVLFTANAVAQYSFTDRPGTLNSQLEWFQDIHTQNEYNKFLDYEKRVLKQERENQILNTMYKEQDIKNHRKTNRTERKYIYTY